MQFHFSCTRLTELDDEVVVCFTTETKDVKGPQLKSIDNATSGSLAQLIGSEEFAGKNGQEDKQAFFSEQAKMYSSRMMDIKTQEFKELSNGAG